MLNLGQVRFMGEDNLGDVLTRYTREVMPVPLFLTGYSSLTDIGSYVSVLIKTKTSACRVSACGNKEVLSGEWHRPCPVGWDYY